LPTATVPLGNTSKRCALQSISLVFGFSRIVQPWPARRAPAGPLCE
jgi:hypothetical protein